MCDAFKQSTDGTKIHDFSTIKNDLMIMEPSRFATKWFFDRCPFIFEDNEEEYIRWRHLISQNIDVDPTDIIVTGSASLGVSFNPNKNFKFFDASSDIDICIFSEYYFNVGWHDLRNYPRYGLTSQMQSAIKEHRKHYIYLGTIATDTILPLLSFGGKWARIIPELCKSSRLIDHDIHFRIYKDRQAFRSYLLQSIEDRKRVILEGN